MTITVPRPRLNWRERLYLPGIAAGLAITFKHFKNMLLGRTKVTMQYPEEKSSKDWTLSSRWRGTHRMLTDEQGRAKCVACGLCPQICPANCIKLVPGEDEEGHRYPLIYEIDEFRCIFCGYCQEVCPEEAIFLMQDYSLTGTSRKEMIYNKEKLLALGGVHQDKIQKWKHKAEEAKEQGVAL